MAQPTQEQLNELIKLYQSRKFDEAETEVQNLLKHFPEDITCLNVLGVVLDRKGQTEEAIKMYQKALQINENSAETHFNMGSILHRLGRSNEARISYEKAISIKSDFLNAHFNLGLVYQNLQDSKKAIESYQNAIKLKPDFHQAIGAMGSALQAQGELDEAIEHYKKALAIQPDARNHFNLGAGLRTKGSLDEAIEQFEKSLSFDKENSETLTSLGDAFWHKGKADEAIEKFDEAIKIDPNHPQANYNLGVFLSDNNKLGEAFIHFERSKIHDWQERALYCLYKTEEYENAKIDVRDLSAEEIKQVVLELEARLTGKWQDSNTDLQLQDRFWQIFKSYSLFDKYHGKIHPECRFGAHYLRNSPEWLN